MSTVPEIGEKREQAANQPTHQITETIKFMLSHLSTGEREKILAEITEYVRPIPIERAGDVLSTIVSFLHSQKHWTIEEIKSQVERSGVEATSKEVYNAVGYLTRKRHMRRIGYGRYIVDGVEIVTSEDLGGESARHEDAYRLGRE